MRHGVFLSSFTLPFIPSAHRPLHYMSLVIHSWAVCASRPGKTRLWHASFTLPLPTPPSPNWAHITLQSSQLCNAPAPGNHGDTWDLWLYYWVLMAFFISSWIFLSKAFQGLENLEVLVPSLLSLPSPYMLLHPNASKSAGKRCSLMWLMFCESWDLANKPLSQSFGWRSSWHHGKMPCANMFSLAVRNWTTLAKATRGNVKRRKKALFQTRPRSQKHWAAQDGWSSHYMWSACNKITDSEPFVMSQNPVEHHNPAIWPPSIFLLP